MLRKDLSNFNFDFDSLKYGKSKVTVPAKSNWKNYMIIILIIMLLTVIILVIVTYVKLQNSGCTVVSNNAYELGPPGMAPWNIIGFKDLNAKWIWNIPNADNNAPANINIKFDLIYNSPNDQNAVMYIYTKDTSDVYLNRIKMVTSSLQPTRVILPLLSGDNKVEIIAKNLSGPAGLLFTVFNENETRVLFHSDKNMIWSI